MGKTRLQDMLLAAFFAAIIALLAQIVIPLPVIPITGQTLAIGLTATILGSKKGTLAVCLYLLLGIIGLPVFQGGTAGIGIIFGPTGGYLISFIPVAFLMGLYLERTSYQFNNCLAANLMGMLLTLVIGSIWLKIFGHYSSWQTAFSAGALPFIVVGVIKAVIATWLGTLIRQRLIAARMLAK